MKAKVLFLAMAFGGSWAQVQAEPAVQAGDTLESLSQVKITTSTQTGKMFRLRGKGVKPVRTSMQGDLLCRIVIETPVNLTARQRELLKELQETLDGDDHKSSPKKKSFFDRLFD
jgi:molecular chaperone DnaJ